MITLSKCRPSKYSSFQATFILLIHLFLSSIYFSSNLETSGLVVSCLLSPFCRPRLRRPNTSAVVIVVSCRFHALISLHFNLNLASSILVVTHALLMSSCPHSFSHSSERLQVYNARFACHWEYNLLGVVVQW